MDEHGRRSAKPRHAAGRVPFDLRSFLRTAGGRAVASCVAAAVVIAGVGVLAATSASPSALAAPDQATSPATLDELAQQRDAALFADTENIDAANEQAALADRDKVLTAENAAIKTEAARLKDLSTFLWPTTGPIVSQFGMRYHPILHYYRLHDGIDINAPCGQKIYAAQSGTVTRVGYNSGEGNNVHIDHGDIDGAKIETGYLHMSKTAATVGDYVSKGQLIGYVGSTGLSTGCHLHLQLHKNGAAIDPRTYAKPDNSAAVEEQYMGD